MYVNQSGFRTIERVKGVHHTTVMTWLRQVGELLPDAYDPETVPEVGELDELQTFVGSKKKQKLDLDSCKPFLNRGFWRGLSVTAVPPPLNPFGS